MKKQNLKFFISTLGCSKNLVDSEILVYLLEEKDMQRVDDPELADVIIINTCGFIEAAQQESIHAILEGEQYKQKGKCRTLVVTGCLSQRFGKELTDLVPEIDVLLGTGNFPELPRLLEKRNAVNGRFLETGSPGYDYSQSYKRTLLTPQHLAYLKIAEGCSNCCSYCLIPHIRGPFRSRPKELLLHEARGLIENGVKEINLIAQDTSAYGWDAPENGNLAGLLEDMAFIDGVGWVRFLYSYPSRITKDLLRVIRDHDTICSYLDIPLQHVNSELLKKMNREGDSSSLLRLVDTIREYVPDISLRTTFIVGFPGETRQQFEELLAFVEKARFDWVGVFSFSAQEGTYAYSLGGHIPEKEKELRVSELMELQAGITHKRNSRWVGRNVRVLVEGKSEENPELLSGRTQGQGPEVDGVVLIDKASEQHIGQFAEVRITNVDQYDLLGEVVG